MMLISPELFQNFMFYLFATMTVGSAMAVVSVKNTIYSALFLVLCFFNTAVLWMLIEAEFLAITLVLVYVGAVMVLFLFVVMMLNLGKGSVAREHAWLRPSMWILPCLLTVPLFLGLVYALSGEPAQTAAAMVSPKTVGTQLFGPYLLAVELAGILLLAALVGAYHLGRRYLSERREEV